MTGSTTRDILKKIINDTVPVIGFVPCVVVSRNDTNLTCICKPLNGIDNTYEDVKIQASPANGMILYPTVNSIVLIQPGQKDLAAYVAMVSACDKIKMLDGSFGGLTKTQELKTQIDKLNAQLQAVINSLQNWTVVPSDGGAALKTYFAAQIVGKPAGSFTNIENTNVLHGIP